MTNRVLLNNVDHGGLTVSPRFGAAYGDAVNAVRLFPTEYEEARAEYPILFRRDEESGQLFAVALLGFEEGENLFLDGERWKARYVPAVQARGPFSIGVSRDTDGVPGEPMIHVDLDDPRIGGGGGQPVFLPQGGNSTYLDAVAGVLRRITVGLEADAAMFAAFERFGLIAPRRIEIEAMAGRRFALTGFLTIDAARLAALDGAGLEALHRAGFLSLAFAALGSLANVNRLIELKADVRHAA